MDQKAKKALGIVLKLLVWALMILSVIFAFTKPEYGRIPEAMSYGAVMLCMLVYAKDKGLAVLCVLIFAIIFVTSL